MASASRLNTILSPRQLETGMHWLHKAKMDDIRIMADAVVSLLSNS